MQFFLPLGEIHSPHRDQMCTSVHWPKMSLISNINKCPRELKHVLMTLWAPNGVFNLELSQVGSVTVCTMLSSISHPLSSLIFIMQLSHLSMEKKLVNNQNSSRAAQNIIYQLGLALLFHPDLKVICQAETGKVKKVNPFILCPQLFRAWKGHGNSACD